MTLSSAPLLPASPAAPVAPYQGGKRNLARRIVTLIAQTPHTTFAEPFVGMGGIFFRRTSRPKAEIINDASRDVATLFRVLQRHYVPLMDMLRWQVTSRSEFERLKAANPETLTDLERVARFLYLQRTAFGGKITGRSFGVNPTGPARFDVTRLAAVLEEAHERLAGVVIECLHYAAFIKRYDRPGTLLYIDPPYWGCEADYGANVFSRKDFAHLAELLGQIQGRFILSLNDLPEVRETFAAFHIEAVATTYTISGKRPMQAGELLITGP